MSAQHVIPSDDLREHTTESTCQCDPKLKMHEGEMVFVHQSYDGREYMERALGTENTDDSLAFFVGYTRHIASMTDWVGEQWVADKIGQGFANMYHHWRQLDIEIKFE